MRPPSGSVNSAVSTSTTSITNGAAFVCSVRVAGSVPSRWGCQPITPCSDGERTAAPSWSPQTAARRCCSAPGVDGWTHARPGAWCTSGWPRQKVCRTPVRTACATPQPPTCWKAAPTCAASRRSWATRPWRLPRSTRTSPSSGCAPATGRHIRARSTPLRVARTPLRVARTPPAPSLQLPAGTSTRVARTAWGDCAPPPGPGRVDYGTVTRSFHVTGEPDDQIRAPARRPGFRTGSWRGAPLGPRAAGRPAAGVHGRQAATETRPPCVGRTQGEEGTAGMAPVVTMKQLLESGVHFGHQTRRWNPKMKRFIFTERNGIYIIDLQQSLDYIDRAYEFIRETVAHGGTILYVGTKKQAQEAIAEQARRVGMPFVNQRWLGGMLTNFGTVFKRLQRLKELEEVDFDDVAGSTLTKKELLHLKRERDKLDRSLGGIRHMTRVPSAVWVVDTKKEHIAVSEARKLGIPVIAILDTNCDPDEVTYPIPGNDDAIRSVALLTRVIADAVADGLIARAGASTDSDEKPSADIGTEEPLAEWERELLPSRPADDAVNGSAPQAAPAQAEAQTETGAATEATEQAATGETATEAPVTDTAAATTEAASEG